MKANKKFAEDMQAVLVDMIELQLQGKQVHWNVVGSNFRDIHLQLDEIVAAARTFSDQIAERMRALHVAPDGRTASVVSTTSLAPLPDGEISTTDAVDVITARLESAVGTIRRVHDRVDEADPTTADILHGFIEKLEQFAWMVSAENRAPGGDRVIAKA